MLSFWRDWNGRAFIRIGYCCCWWHYWIKLIIFLKNYFCFRLFIVLFHMNTFLLLIYLYGTIDLWSWSNFHEKIYTWKKIICSIVQSIDFSVGSWKLHIHSFHVYYQYTSHSVLKCEYDLSVLQFCQDHFNFSLGKANQKGFISTNV